jgi:sigma-B regulation protein RsbU (phosphoserine phosphatase)
MVPQAAAPLPDTSLFHRRSADGRRRVLVVDDEPVSRRLVSAVLGVQGFEVLEASDGAEAHALIQRLATERLSLDCLILDLFMPVLDGVGLLDRLIMEGLVVPVLAMSASGDRDTILRLMRLGCDEFLDKPFTPDQLSTRVCDFLARTDRATALRRGREERLKIEKTRLENDSERYARDARDANDSVTRLSAQIETARTVYQDLIGTPAGIDGLDLIWRNQPLAAMGGDFFGCRGNQVLVADVAGHDLGASLLGVMVKAFFEENCRGDLTGVDFLRRLNQQLCDSAQTHRLVTAVLLNFDLKRLSFEAVCAGHPPPIVLRATGADPVPVPGCGSVLGMGPEVVLSAVRCPLAPGDRILLCTDGVLDVSRITPAGRQRLGPGGLRAAALQANAGDLTSMVEGAWQAVLAHCRHKPVDDMLLAGIEVRRPETSDYEPQPLDDDASAIQRRV